MSKGIKKEKGVAGRRGPQDGPIIVDSKAAGLPQPRVRIDQDVIDEAKARIAVKKSQFRLPTREELAIMALDVYRLALDHKRAYKDRHGNEVSYPQPEFSAALQAARLVGELAGLVGKHSDKPNADDEESIDSAERAIQKLRSKLAVEKLG